MRKNPKKKKFAIWDMDYYQPKTSTYMKKLSQCLSKEETEHHSGRLFTQKKEKA